MIKKTVVCTFALTAIGILMTGVASCHASQQTDSVEVGPWRFRAQDFIYPGGGVYLFADPAAADGWCPKTDRQLTFVDFPFPRTNKPVTVYLRVWPSNTAEEFRLTARVNGTPKTLASLKAEQIGKWQWHNRTK